jgi:hypothetical protein
LKETLKVKKDFTVAEAQKAYKLFHCFDVDEVQTQWDRIVNKMHTKNSCIGMNGQSHKGLCIHSWISFMDCIKLHKLTIFTAEATEKQHYYMQQTMLEPRAAS